MPNALTAGRRFLLEHLVVSTADPRRHPVRVQVNDVTALEDFPVAVMLQGCQELFRRYEEYLYEPELKRTKIIIADKFPDGLEETEWKPAVVSDRGTIRSMQINGRGHNEERALKPGAASEPGRLVRVFRQMLTCPLTFHCIAKEGIDASKIASIVFAMLVTDEDRFKPRGVHAITDVQLGSDNPVDYGAGYDLMECPVSCTLQFAWAWAIGPDGPTFKKFETTLTP